MITFDALLIDKQEVAPGVFYLTFENGIKYRLDFKAGQYVIATIPSKDGVVKRLYSLASSPLNTSSFSLLVKRVEGGVGSVYLSDMMPGGTVFISGPAGLFTLRDTLARKVFLTTGTGVAPMLSILSTHKDMSASLFWGVQTMKDVYFLDLFKKLKEGGMFLDCHICLSRELAPPQQTQEGFCFFSGRISEAIQSYVGRPQTEPEKNNYEYYICGSRTVVESMRLQLLSLGIDSNHIFFEKY